MLKRKSAKGLWFLRWEEALFDLYVVVKKQVLSDVKRQYQNEYGNLLTRNRRMCTRCYV
jgi:hypothetical protein